MNVSSLRLLAQSSRVFCFEVWLPGRNFFPFRGQLQLVDGLLTVFGGELRCFKAHVFASPHFLCGSRINVSRSAVRAVIWHGWGGSLSGRGRLWIDVDTVRR